MALIDCFSHLKLFVKCPLMRFVEIVMHVCSNENLAGEGDSVIMEMNEPSISKQCVILFWEKRSTVQIPAATMMQSDSTRFSD